MTAAPSSNLVGRLRLAEAEHCRLRSLQSSLLGEAAEWIDRASALLPLVWREAGSELAEEVSELLSQQPPQLKPKPVETTECRACKDTGWISTGTPGERIPCDCDVNVDFSNFSREELITLCRARAKLIARLRQKARSSAVEPRETTPEPVAWRAWMDSRTENTGDAGWEYRACKPTLTSVKWEPLYTRPAVEPSPPQQPPIDNAHVAEGCEQFAEVLNTVEIRTFTNHPPAACVVQTPVCPKCGQIDVRIPRMGIYHVCPTPNQDGQQTPAPSGHAGLGTTGQSPSAVRSSENGSPEHE